MYNDPVEAEYYTRRLQTSLDMAAKASEAGTALAHQGLAACYRAKLMSLLRVEALSVARPRAVLSLNAFRGSKQATPFQMNQSAGSLAVSMAGR